MNPAAVAAMAEVGIDIAKEFPKPWTDEIVQAADVVVTMGCGDACPLYPGKRYEDWELDDPAGQSSTRCAPSATRSASGCVRFWRLARRANERRRTAGGGWCLRQPGRAADTASAAPVEAARATLRSGVTET